MNIFERLNKQIHNPELVSESSPSKPFGLLRRIFKKAPRNDANAFALVEVLITLVIIGVVATMTISTLVAKAQQRALIAQLKETYSILQQAYSASIAENSDPSTWGLDLRLGGIYWDIDQATFEDYFKPYLKITKYCARLEGCFPDTLFPGSSTDTLNNNYNYTKAMLANGSSVAFSGSSFQYCNVSYAHNNYVYCGTITVDVNGLKKPNKWGEDTFTFLISHNGIFPAGIPTLKMDGSMAGIFSFEHCKFAASLGYYNYCTMWAIQKENFDYESCKDATCSNNLDFEL